MKSKLHVALSGIFLLSHAPSVSAVVVSGDSPAPPLFQSPPDSTFPTLNVLGTATGASAIYLCNNWVLTAGHVGLPDVFTQEFDAAGNETRNTATYIPGTEMRLGVTDPNTGLGSADLRIYQVSGNLNLPCLSLYCDDPSVGTDVVMAGFGNTSLGNTSPNPLLGNYPWVTSFQSRWGTNQLETSAADSFGNPVLVTDFSSPLDSPTMFEGQNAGGDSGGGWFINNGGTWELAGLSFAVGSTDGTSNPSEYGDRSFAYDLSDPLIKSQIQEVAYTPEPSSALLAGLSCGLLLARRRR